MIPAALLTLLWDAARALAIAWVVVQNPWARGRIAAAWRRFSRWMPESRINEKIGELRGGLHHIWDSLALYLLRLEALELGANLPVVTTDAAGGLLWASPPYLALVGAPLTAVVQQGWAGFIHPDDQDRVFKLWNAAQEGNGSTLVMEFRLINEATGRPVWVHSQIRPARSQHTGRVAGWVATLSPLSRPPMWFTDQQPRRESGCPSGFFEPPMGT